MRKLRIPRLKKPIVAQALRKGDMVVCPTGRLGVVIEIEPLLSISTVTFGADGPVGRYDWKRLRHASAKEIRAAGLYGVGCNTPPY